jgi:hypothetical protein
MTQVSEPVVLRMRVLVLKPLVKMLPAHPYWHE